MVKSKEEIEEYIKSKKGSFTSLFKRDNQEYIAFRNERGMFNGWIKKDKNSINAVKKYNGFKYKIKVKIKGQRGKKTFIYKIYNKKQQQDLLFRMNSKLRDKSQYKSKQRRKDLLDTNFKNDSVPIIKGKKKVDLLFDKYNYEPVIIEQFQGESP